MDPKDQAFIDHVANMARAEREYRYEQAHRNDVQAFWTLVVLLAGLASSFYFFGFVPTALGLIILLLLGLVGHTTETF